MRAIAVEGRERGMGGREEGVDVSKRGRRENEQSVGGSHPTCVLLTSVRHLHFVLVPCPCTCTSWSLYGFLTADMHSATLYSHFLPFFAPSARVEERERERERGCGALAGSSLWEHQQKSRHAAYTRSRSAGVLFLLLAHLLLRVDGNWDGMDIALAVPSFSPLSSNG